MIYHTCQDTNYAIAPSYMMNLIQDIETFSSSTILQSQNNIMFILSFYCLIKSGLVDTDGKWTADGQ